MVYEMQQRRTPGGFKHTAWSNEVKLLEGFTLRNKGNKFQNREVENNLSKHQDLGNRKAIATVP